MVKNKKTISIIIIAGNEEKMISECVKSCSWADELILVAANSNDKTKIVAKKNFLKIKIIETNDEYNKNFTKWRNLGYKKAKSDWILYIDADERVTKELKEEILLIINNKNSLNYFAIPRANHFLGKRVMFGGTYPDYVKRLYRTKYFQGYKGILHEEPIVMGEIGYIKNDLMHFTHRDLSSMLNKTNIWTDMEAEALFNSNHPPVVWWRFIRMMLTKFLERFVFQKMWKDGVIGFISVIFEVFDTYIIYAKLWELQQKHKNTIIKQ